MSVVNYLKKVQLPNNTEYTVKDPTFFTGTTEEWNLLSTEEKQSYKIVNLTDDSDEAKTLTHCRLNVNWGNVTSGTVYSYNLTSAIPEITHNAFRSISIMCAKGNGTSTWDTKGTYNYCTSSDGNSIVLQYECAYTQNSAVSEVDVLYQS